MEIIIPSILEENINEYIRLCTELSKFSKIIHIDIMDGLYVKAKSPSAEEVYSKTKNLFPFKSFHLMIDKPIDILEKLYTQSDIHFLYIHIEFLNKELVMKYSDKIVPVIRIEQNIPEFKEIIKISRHLQIMTVEIGAQGNIFLAENLNKIKLARELGFKGKIHVDGHVTAENIPEIMKFKPYFLNVGSAITKATNPSHEYLRLRNLTLAYDVSQSTS